MKGLPSQISNLIFFDQITKKAKKAKKAKRAKMAKVEKVKHLFLKLDSILKSSLIL